MALAAAELFKGAIEQILDRKVTGFVSGVDVGVDLAAEIFVLEPAGQGASTGSEP